MLSLVFFLFIFAFLFSVAEGRRRVYFEEKEVPLDRMIFCDECEIEFVDGCKKHRLKPVFDEKVSAGPNRAMRTAPKNWVQVKESKIPNACLGVWSVKFIPTRIRFGPYEGKFSVDADTSSYTWIIRTKKKPIYLNAADESSSNWLRYVNCSRNNDEQNLVSYQYKGKIYYRTVKPIPPETELLVSYGPTYEHQLGINRKPFLEKPYSYIKGSGNLFLSCRMLNAKFSIMVLKYLPQTEYTYDNKFFKFEMWPRLS